MLPRELNSTVEKGWHKNLETKTPREREAGISNKKKACRREGGGKIS